jgi:hypothetical protein
MNEKNLPRRLGRDRHRRRRNPAQSLGFMRQFTRNPDGEISRIAGPGVIRAREDFIASLEWRIGRS